ncbi:heat shock protein DnaJ domain protein [Geobacter metallireducens RCH3]|uniref:DnaJ domain protein n=1 Tax=Geobacter metallireducens (strain ATCC 53774 / DSM 7210 / GS-15) TaxID=269799 RepID=Q39ZG3_GEOMG|nr:J domain-containing protein [Geobacter metallireducens]ABB30361.1 DnaJ domain protein [Geobacter metallireducens GS-15]EHP85026.1 heat shock protein DnaJ domain protein [Geobacter metallireducens RCH3]
MNDVQRAFDLLQLKPGASPAEVKRAFRDQVAAWHPDRFSADPIMQRRAEERLRLVIEAHRSIVSYHEMRASGEMAAGHRVQGDDRGLSSPAGSFFRSVPNCVFCVVVLGCALLGLLRHGMTIHAWIYGVEMALIPALFSLAYNLAGRGNLVVRNLYLGFCLCALAVVVVDGAMIGVERSAPAGEGEVFSPRGNDGGAVGGGWPLPRGGGRDLIGEGLAPASHEPPSPRAPALPLAPMAPAAPHAPAAPLAPLAH